MTATAIVLCAIAVFLGGPMLIGWALSQPDRCISCRRRVDDDTDVQVVRYTGRLICARCLRTVEPYGLPLGGPGMEPWDRPASGDIG